MPRTRIDETPLTLDEPEIGGRSAAAATAADVRTLAGRFVGYLETGEAPEGLFAPGVFVDFSMPTWRLQAEGRDAALALRRRGHPEPGRVPRSRVDPTPTGFVLEAEETWEAGGRRWYCRELFRADTGPEGITELAVYCTGDWDEDRVAEHAAAVPLPRP